MVLAASTEVQHVHGVRLDDEVRQVGADDAVAQVVLSGDWLAPLGQHGARLHVDDEKLHARVDAVYLKHNTTVRHWTGTMKG